MKKNISFIITILAMFNVTSLLAQQKPLQVGDRMPDVNIPLIFNGEHKTVSTGDFRGKLLILDFWGTWCAPCVANIPKMDSLQREFKGKVEFLPITDEPLERVSGFAAHFLKETGIAIKTVYQDRTLKKLFDYGSLPLYVWIDSTGTIIAKTSSEALTASNLSMALQHRLSGVKNRTDKRSLAIDRTKPVFNLYFDQILDDGTRMQHLIGHQKIIGQSIGTAFVPGLPIGLTTNDSTRYFSSNTAVARMYAHLYSMIYYGNNNLGIQSDARTVYDINSPEKLEKIRSTAKGDEYLDFLEKNGGCYEIIWPKTIAFGDYQTKFTLIKADLDRYFGIPLGIDAGIEKRQVKQCLVLENSGSTALLKTKGGRTEESFDRYSYALSNGDFSRFFNRLSGYYFQLSDMPVIDQSGIKGNVDLQLKCNIADLKEVNGELEKYGLRLTVKPALADVLVFKDR